MTGDELTMLLQRHGLEVASARWVQDDGGAMPRYYAEAVDVAAVSLDAQQLPYNVEIEVQRQGHRRNFISELRPFGTSRGEWQTVAHIRGDGRDVLTSLPSTASQLRLRREGEAAQVPTLPVRA